MATRGSTESTAKLNTLWQERHIVTECQPNFADNYLDAGRSFLSKPQRCKLVMMQMLQLEIHRRV